MDTRICILDYGSGNVQSVNNAFRNLQIESIISNDTIDISNSTHLVLPGVGGFSSSMQKIRASLPLESIELQIKLGKPFLGICVGMQVLSKVGFEFGETSGFGYFQGQVVKFPDSSLPIPHVGWNNVEYRENSKLFMGMDESPDFYFVHSFYLDASIDHPEVAGYSNYIVEFASAVERDNIFGVQFHPEKSQKNGKTLLRNFASVR